MITVKEKQNIGISIQKNWYNDPDAIVSTMFMLNPDDIIRYEVYYEDDDKKKS